MDNSNAIGKRIKALRERENLTQLGLAQALKKKFGFSVKRETINYWENGERDLKTDYTIILAKFFGVTCDEILRGVKAENVDIHDKTGLSDEAISNLIKFGEYIAWALNKLLENIEFLGILARINALPLDAENREYYILNSPSGDEKIISDRFLNNKRKAERILGNPITLDPPEFYDLANREIIKAFGEVVNDIMIAHINSIDVKAVVESRKENYKEQQTQRAEAFYKAMDDAGCFKENEGGEPNGQFTGSQE